MRDCPFNDWRILGSRVEDDLRPVTVSSRSVWIRAGRSAAMFQDAAEERDRLTLGLAPPGTAPVTMEFEQVFDMGWSTAGEQVFELLPGSKTSTLALERLFRCSVLNRAVQHCDATFVWRWCLAGSVGGIAEFDPDGLHFAACDPKGVFTSFVVTGPFHGGQGPIDIVLGSELVTWVPAYFASRGRGVVGVSAVTDEVGLPLRLLPLGKFIAERRRAGAMDDLASWQEAIRERFLASDPE